MKEAVRLETQSSAMSWLLRAICKTRRPCTHVATSPKSRQNMQIKPSLRKWRADVLSMAIALWYITHSLQRESWAWNEWKGNECSNPFAVFDCHPVSKPYHRLDSETPREAKEHLNCTNYALVHRSRPKETQKVYFFSASYHKDHW